MRIVVCVKYVPVLTAMRFDPVTRRLAREGVPGEVSSFDLRALGRAVALRAEHGGEIVALTMGPPAARAGLEDCLALGADRAVHVMDPLLAGSDTLATARTLAAALLREEADLILFGRSSTDAETGQVGPEVAELLDLAQVTGARRLDVDPAARTFTAERETDEGFETVEGALPAVITAAEDIAEERFPKKAEREAAKTKPIAAVGVADLGLAAGKVGEAGSPTWVAGVEQVEIARRGELVAGDSPEALAAALGERIRSLVPPRAEPAPLPERTSADGPALWVVCELGPKGVRPVTAELLAKAATLATALGGRVEAVAIGGGREHAAALAAAGADRVLVAESPGLEQYTTETHAAVLAEAIRVRQPRLVLLGATVRGRDLAPRVAARLGLGLTGDAIELDVDGEGRVRQLKPAFGGAVVAPILSHTRPEMATVRPGVLSAARVDPARRPAIEALAVPVVPSRVRVTATRAIEGAGRVDLDEAEVVIGIGRGVGGPAGVSPIVELAARIGAGVAATREVTDAGWLPRQHQVGLTGRAIAPRLYVAVAIGGAAEHLVGIRRAGLVVAINKNAKAPILKAADLGVVADYAALLPHLASALRLA